MVEKDKKYYEKQETPVLFVNKGTGVTVAPSFTWVIESYRQNPEWEEVTEEVAETSEKAPKTNKKDNKKSDNVAEEVAKAVAGV